MQFYCSLLNFFDYIYSSVCSHTVNLFKNKLFSLISLLYFITHKYLIKDQRFIKFNKIPRNFRFVVYSTKKLVSIAYYYNFFFCLYFCVYIFSCIKMMVGIFSLVLSCIVSLRCIKMMTSFTHGKKCLDSRWLVNDNNLNDVKLNMIGYYHSRKTYR